MSSSPNLPLTRLTLYKHGIGFFHRQGKFTGETAVLTLQTEEMNDFLQSLIVLDRSGGQILGVAYDTPREKAAILEDCSVHLGDHNALRDLIQSLRGLPVTLEQKEREPASGLVIGLEEPAVDPTLENSFISLLGPDENVVASYRLSEIIGLTLDNEQAGADLRFFLEINRKRSAFRAINLQLTPGEHELEVSYNAPAPTWRWDWR